MRGRGEGDGRAERGRTVADFLHLPGGFAFVLDGDGAALPRWVRRHACGLRAAMCVVRDVLSRLFEHSGRTGLSNNDVETVDDDAGARPS